MTDTVDHDDESVMVDGSKDEIENPPASNDAMVADQGYRSRLGSYYDAAGR